MRFVNIGRIVTVRRNPVTDEWETWSLTSRAWVPASVPNDYSWDDVHGYYSGYGARVRYSTTDPESLPV